jgi:diguanylate cyclase (GGDEF)-like protein
MSFRSRLTTFFVLIVIVPMVGVGFLVFRLIADSQQGKVDARASGLATAAQSLYESASASAGVEARAIASSITLRAGPRLHGELRDLLLRTGLSRIELVRGARVLESVGSASAIAPGVATVVGGAGVSTGVYVSTITASQYAAELSRAGAGVVVAAAGRTLAAIPAEAGRRRLGGRGSANVGGIGYRYVTQSFAGFPGAPVRVVVLSNLSATSNSTGTSRLVAAVFIAGFLLLAFGFSILASRALQAQLSGFLQAARRLAGGDFSSQVPIEGSDEFAALGEEFNNMSAELARRLDELSRERVRLRESIRRIGRTFAANLDPPALLELALRASMDAVRADRGRLTVRPAPGEPLQEALQVGTLTGAEEQFLTAERIALASAELGEAGNEEVNVAAVALGGRGGDERPEALISVGRTAPFSDDDRDLLRSLASQGTLALENIELHFQVQRQAVTDELTGLANHGRFQELLSAEVEQVLRYGQGLSLIMIDLDDFKSVNDSCGHQQGDVVLREVARVLRESSRDADAPARYGGEELALILPHTDLDGAYAIAERVRTAIEALRVPRLDGGDPLQVTASLGVAAAGSGGKDTLIAEADGALYAAKRAGKNRTMRAPIVAANLPGGE